MTMDNGSRTTVNDRTLTAPAVAGPSLLARCPVVPVVVLDHPDQAVPLGEALLAGCRGHLPLRDLCELLALAHGRDPEELTAAALPVVRELFLHGMVVSR